LATIRVAHNQPRVNKNARPGVNGLAGLSRKEGAALVPGQLELLLRVPALQELLLLLLLVSQLGVDLRLLLLQLLQLGLVVQLRLLDLRLLVEVLRLRTTVGLASNALWRNLCRVVLCRWS
jgi:hypothetical protein